MQQEILRYTIPSDDQSNPGCSVAITLSYDETTQNDDGSFTVTDAQGSFSVLDQNGNVTRVDQVSGLAPYGWYGSNDNEIFLEGSAVVSTNGITFIIDNIDDSNDGAGDINFYVDDAGEYHQLGPNTSAAKNVELSPAIESISPVCFAQGTLILTTRGNVAVENLAVGDLVVTASGATRPIRWLGHRPVDTRRYAVPQQAAPIRICAHAFGQGRPARDLMVSPGHSICVDVIGEVLIPALHLINGSTIIQTDIIKVVYWHIELDEHEIILAEGLPTESYLEMGNRSFFAENQIVALVESLPDRPVRTHADFCRPFHGEGPLVECVRDRLTARAQELGWFLESPALDEVHLLVDGVCVKPEIRDQQLRFLLRANAKHVWLVSGSAVPCHMPNGNKDTRSLGIGLARLVVNDGFREAYSVTADDPRLCVGFHETEPGPFRWTAGRARLPAELWQDCRDTFFLCIDVTRLPLPRWSPPPAQDGDTACWEGRAS